MILAVLLSILCTHAQFSDHAKKSPYSWSLQEWLEQKDRIRFMDLWLMFNDSSPFEFYLGGGSGNLDALVTETVEERTWINQFELGAYASVTGIEGDYTITPENESMAATFNIRLLGPAIQSTNWKIFAGQMMNRTVGVDEAPVFRHLLLGTAFSIYWFKYSGTKFQYRTFEKSKQENGDYFGHDVSGTLFIDYSFFRMFARYTETVYQTPSGESKKNSTIFGLKIFL